MNSRIKRLFSQLGRSCDALLLSDSANVSYLTGYQSRDSFLLVTAKSLFFLTDGRYSAEARKHLQGAQVIQLKNGLFKDVSNLCSRWKCARIGFEERHLSYSAYQRFKQVLAADQELVPVGPLVEQLRQIKSAEEVRKIRLATDLACEALSYIRTQLRPGLTELEVSGEIERFIRSKGASGSSFEIIVASGPNSSYAHHLTGTRRLKQGEPVMIDMGVDLNGYKSDLTRVFFMGKINLLAQKLYSIVLTAQRKAIEAIRPGVPVSSIDRAARDYIASKGYARQFLHSLGHGVGLAVHEEPGINASSKKTIEPGMVFTVEPAVYLAGRCGIRIEDMVLVTEKKCEVLSGALDK